MRFHTSLPVNDLPETLTFYRTLFGEDPVKTKEDYAKFLPVGLALNLSFHPGPEAAAQLAGLHLGLEFADQAALDAAFARLEAAGLVSSSRETSVCCYASQDKFHVTDPSGYVWELYRVVEDTDHRIDEASACCAPAVKVSTSGCC